MLTQLGITAAGFAHPEDRVVSSPLAHGLVQDLAAADALGLEHGGAVWGGQGHRAVEAGAAVGRVAKLGQQTGNALAVTARIAGRIHARRTSQGIDLQSGIVGQRPRAGQLGHSLGLEPGIVQVGGAGFLDRQAVGLLLHVQRQIAEHGGNVSHLGGIATGDHQNDQDRHVGG